MFKRHFIATCVCLAQAVVLTGCADQTSPVEEASPAPAITSAVAYKPQPVDFARQILPILSDKCFACHGPDTRKADLLRLDSFEHATRDLGGYRAINPDDLSKSELILRVHDELDPMPPKKADKQLTDEERELLTRWINEGGAYAKHWAFVPPTKRLPQDVTGSAAIDHEIGEQLKERQIGFAPEADRATLARRVSLVLTGLPLEPATLEAYLKDTKPGAYDRLVDQLLDSPRYGEHQARYWLDAVRYGDTHGLHLDSKRGIYPYRDWVVRAYNANLPMDQFILWQLAGDMLDKPTLDQLIATGFVRMNPSTAEGGAIPAEFQAKNNFDRVETIGTALMGMSLICARCHTHKYDPITHTEYFEMLAFFNSTAEQPLDGNKYDYAPVIKAPADQAAWRQWQALEQEARQLVGQDTADNNPETLISQVKTIVDTQGANPDGTPTAALLLYQRMNEAQKAFTTTLIAKELPSPRETKVLDRGEYDLAIGEPLSPSVFEVMGELPADMPNNRLGLAQWLTAREHPLTSRVMINRVWQRVFGYGLVRTPEEFGLQGEQPTHPQLLDYLAVEFQDSGWDLKHMLRLMVTSRTFKQSSVHRKEVDDPENRLFARGPGHRLEAEEIRDVALWASGLLREEMGGEGFKPYQPAGMWEALAHPASNTKQYVQDTGDKQYRRSLYVYWKRTSPHPMMTLFDAPSRETSCVRRSRTNTALQSLGLLNEMQRTEMARVLAERLILSEKDDARRLERLFTMLASRGPSKTERAACGALLTQMKARYAEAEADAMALLSVGDYPRDEKLSPAEHAAWTQVVVTVLASDVAIRLY